MDKEAIAHYGWIVVVLIIGLLMILMSTPLSNYIVSFMKADVIEEVMENRDVAETEETAFHSEYQIKYMLSDGAKFDGSYIKTYVSGYEIDLPVNVVRKNYAFAGWYEASNPSTLITKISASTEGDIELYPRWVSDSYIVSYNLGGGKFVNDSQVPFIHKYGAETTLPIAVNIEKDGKTFDGWYTSPTFKGTKYTKIPADKTDGLVFYAKWS